MASDTKPDQEESVEQRTLITTADAAGVPHKNGTVMIDRIADVDKFVANFGAALGRSGLMGTSRPEVGQVIAMTLLMKNIDPLDWKRRNHIIPTKGGVQLTMHYAAMLADFRARGGRQRWIERTPERVEMEINFEGHTQRYAITHDDVKGEPYYWRSENGKQVPQQRYATPQARMQQLTARLVHDTINVLCPEICYGVYPEEVAADFAGDPVQVEIEAGPVTTIETPVAGDVETIEAEPEATAKPAEETKSSALDFDTDDPSRKPLTQKQLQQIAELKREGKFGSDVWKKTLKHHYKVDSARDLETNQADRLIARLQGLIREKQETVERKEWAENAVKQKLASGQKAMAEN